MKWTPAIVGNRLLWTAGAIAIALLAASLFRRFDPARRRLPRASKSKISATTIPPKTGMDEAIRDVAPPRPSRILDLNAPAPLARSRFLGLVQGEIRLLLLGQRW